MTYRCIQCGADLAPRSTRCSSCGKQFDVAVPSDNAPASWDDNLLARSANREGRRPMPDFATGGDRPRKTRRPWTLPGIGLAAIAVMVGIVAGGYALVMSGPIGDAIYREHNLTGNEYLGRSNYQAAYNEYSAMIAMRPNGFSGYSLRAICDQQAGWWNRCVDDATAALPLTNVREGQGDVLYNCAHAYGQMGRWPLAIRNYTEAAKRYALETNSVELPDIPLRQENTLRSRADAYWMHKDYALGIDDCDFIIAHDQIHPEDYGVKAKCEMAIGENAAAISDFGSAIKLDPSYLPAYGFLGDMADKSHDYTSVIKLYEQGIRENPYNADIMGSLGWFQYQAGQIPAAIETDKHALSLDQTQSWIVNNLALCYAVTGDKADAASIYTVALSTEPANTKEPAIADIQHAIDNHPDAPVLAFVLALNQSGTVSTGFHSLPASITHTYKVAAPPVPAAFDALLAADTQQVGYALRPPAGYTFVHQHEQFMNGYKIIDLWSGPTRPDGTVPTLQVTLNFDDGTYAASTTSVQSEQQFMSLMSENHSPFTQTTPTPISFGTCDFERGTWVGTGVKTHRDYKGIDYICTRSGEYIELAIHDAAPYAATTFPLLCASAETFRRTEAEPWQPNATAR